ncbi:hypothetical protein BB029_17425 [Pseudomonas sp. S3E12]|nr:hypothetical protein BB029_17425 [Pseudomonas sp. S3E12]
MFQYASVIGNIGFIRATNSYYLLRIIGVELNSPLHLQKFLAQRVEGGLGVTSQVTRDGSMI